MLANVAVLFSSLACVEAPVPEAADDTVGVERGIASEGERVVVRLRVKGAAATASAHTDLGDLGLDITELRSSAEGNRAALNFARNWREPDSYGCQIQNVCIWPKESPEPICEDQEVCGYTRNSWENFAGVIPVDDFLSTKTMAKLSTDLTRATPQYYEYCTADDVLGTVECREGGPVGRFDIVWQTNGDYSKFENGLTEERTPRTLRRSRGITYTDSADVSGTGLGFTFTQDGQIQRGRGTSVQKEWVLLK